ncbi:MAG: hypothetical protein KGL39_31800 [Patescibacteria group bacterium]|nr:hypothetical protein [Patescibacteria group bacterium]
MIYVGTDWQELAAQAQPFIEAAARDGVQVAAEDLGDVSQETVAAAEDEAVQYAADRAAELVGMRNVGGVFVPNPDARWAITETTRDRLSALIEQAVREGWSSQGLAKAIRDDLAFSGYRASMIARTEIRMANTAGTLATWRKSGVVAGKKVVLDPLHDIDDECDMNAAEGVVALDKDFSSGDDGPPFHPHCKCALIAVLKEQYAKS